jgi:hypothetical protein
MTCYKLHIINCIASNITKEKSELLSRLDIESVSVVVRRGRWRWFGRVERKQPDDWVSACRHIVVESVKGRGRGRPWKTWRECVVEDISMFKLSVMDTQKRAVWRSQHQIQLLADSQ